MSWSKIPLALLIAALGNAALVLLLLMASSTSNYDTFEKVFLARWGGAFVVKGFALFGALELAKLLRRRAAFGARIAMAGWAATFVIWLVQVALALKPAWQESAGSTVKWAWWAAMVAIGVGLALAAMRKPVPALAGGALWLLAAARPPFLEPWLWRHVYDDASLRLALLAADAIVETAVVLWLASIAVGDVPDSFTIREPRRFRAGMAKIAGSLWLRLIAVAIVPVITVVVMGDPHHGYEAVCYTTVAAALVNVVALVGFGIGALDAARACHPEVTRTPFYLAAAGALWCAGVTLQQVPELYRSLFDDPGNFPYERAQAIVGAFEYVLPLVTVAAVGAWTIGIDRYATRRERLDLSERSQRTAVLFIVLSFASFAVTRWLVADARTDGSRALVLLVALTCGVVAMFSAARLAGDAAALGDVVESQLPTATIV